MTIVAINLNKRQAMGEDGKFYPIATMIDKNADETNDPDEANGLIIRIAYDHWLVEWVENFEYKWN